MYVVYYDFQYAQYVGIMVSEIKLVQDAFCMLNTRE